MNKADLKKKWSKYCDTDKLVDDTMATLKKYGHRNSEHGVCVVLDKYFVAKEPLIKLFQTSNHYIGDMRIALPKEFERDIDSYQISSFCDHFSDSVGAKHVILEFNDADGKSVSDYLKTGATKVNVATMAKDKSFAERVKKIADFEEYTCATRASWQKLRNFDSFMSYFGNMPRSTISRDVHNNDGIELKTGTKTSRAFNKVCVHYGVDKAPKYNSLFAQYADMVAGNMHKWQFIISLNPLDYLTMSIGQSWTSCHSIVSRGTGVGGLACGGCTSYMLDKVSIITYVVNRIEPNLHEVGKIYRQMYYYSNNLFIQSRLYPQGNDGSTDLYAKFREFMCEEFTELLNLNENKWTSKIGTNYVCDHSEDVGHHYRDARANRSCGIFYPHEKMTIARDVDMVIGSQSYCFYCGEEQNDRNRLSHYSCHT